MKIRQGFVSNSSSASFLVIGVPFEDNMTDEEREEFEEKICQDNLMTLYPGDSDVPEPIIGYTIIDIHDDGWSDEDSGEITLEEFNKIADDMATKFNVDKSKVKIYHGVRSA